MAYDNINRNYNINFNNNSNRQSSVWKLFIFSYLQCIIQFIIITIVALTVVNIVLLQYLDFNQKDWLSLLSQNNEKWCFPLPIITIISLLWIIAFIATPEGTNELEYLIKSLVPSLYNMTPQDHQTQVSTSMYTVLFSSTTATALPRGIWLFYWMIILAMSTPCAIWLAKRHFLLKEEENQERDQYQTTTTTTTTTKTTVIATTTTCQEQEDERVASSSSIHQSVVVSRKYFHLVAVILFTPVTIWSPSMMTLSYAVAICLLIVVEVLRMVTAPWCCVNESHYNDNTSSFIFGYSEIKKNGGNIKDGVKDRKLGRLCSGKKIKENGFTLNKFYQAFLNDKDEQHFFVITHAALVFGCAIPLWTHASIHHLASMNNNDDDGTRTANYKEPELMRLLPFLGIIVLGIGDALGAVAGTYMGRHRWPGSRRTLEGSMSMFGGMFLFTRSLLAFLNRQDWGDNKILLVFAIITILEASTCQVDNFCLPLAGSALLLILTVFESIRLIRSKGEFCGATDTLKCLPMMSSL